MRCLFMPLLALTVMLSSCAVRGAAPRTPTGFELYVDNGSLPPEYQHATEVSGTVAEDGFDLQYADRDAEVEFNRSAALAGTTFDEGCGCWKAPRSRIAARATSQLAAK